MKFPKPVSSRSPVNRRLSIKSSITEPRKLVASVLLLWIGSGRQASLGYADMTSSGQETLTLDHDLRKNMQDYLSGYQVPWADHLLDLLERSPLFHAQLEPLQVALHLVWKLASIHFMDDRPAGDERTGKLRYAKQLMFTAALDVFDACMQDEGGNDTRPWLEVLYHWLGGDITTSTILERKLMRVLAVLAEDTQMKCKTSDGREIEFQQLGIYLALLEDDPQQPVTLGAGDKRGPLRIVSKLIGTEMHPYLLMQQHDVAIRPEHAGMFKGYAQRVDAWLNMLEARHGVVDQDPPETPNGLDANQTAGELVQAAPDLSVPRNWLVFGAPGTGKSYFLEQQRQAHQIDSVCTQRVIFYADYTYGQFVGGYRPAHLYKSQDTAASYCDLEGVVQNRPGEPLIEYQFVPGPLLFMLLRAHQAPGKNHLLLIEELNRADAPAVFGDVFQLLDRNEEGRSRYPVTLSQEAMAYLRSQGLPGHDVVLPPNLFIWATMNNADQGVLPLDTAFRRRWTFQYTTLDAGRQAMADCAIPSQFRDEHGEQRTLAWNGLRDCINRKLAELGVHEDMHIGPFFLTRTELLDDTAFKFKLLAYLRDDVLRHRADDFFAVPGATLSDLLAAYLEGRELFRFPLDC